MAIYGAGSTWYEERIEKKDEFFKNENFVIGWDYDEAKDLYDAVAALKSGDIIYLKSNAPGSRDIRVKGIGVVKHSFIHSLIETKEIGIEQLASGGVLQIPVKWIIKDEFHIHIQKNEGRLTNVRSATFYEEYLPFVQKEILSKLFKI